MEARARNYTIIDGNLYKKGVVQPLLKCISQTEGRELLQEIHSEICGSHIGPRAFVCQSTETRFLLANSHQRRRRDCENMQSLPNLLTNSVRTFSTNSAHITIMAVAKMGNGPGRAVANGPRRKQIRCRSHRILHKMDRSEATSNHNLRNNQEIFLVEHSLQIRSSKPAHSRQREAV